MHTQYPKIGNAIVEYSAPLAISIAAGILGYVVTHYTNNPALELPATLSLTIIGYLVGDKIFLLGRLTALQTHLSGLLGSGFSHVKFSQEVDAVKYLADNVRFCKVVRNTRLEFVGGAATSGPAKKRMSQLDAAVLEAIREGCNYSLVYEAGWRTELNKTVELVSKMRSTRGDIVGGLFLYELSVHGLPLPQMTLLDFKDGRRELLVGWSVAGGVLPNTPVLLIRGENTDIVELYERIYESYQRNAEVRVI
jgi:hypothetical protein